ncbi:MAG: oligosaccharide flippase family protein, partial [Symploca sp. SIO3E6]|nr:oligosaccharide flippase family protein [Caldora sp. SIO3E6]
LIGMGLIPLQALVQLQMETTRAMNDVTLAYAPYLVIWPVLVLSGGFLLLEKNHSLTSLPMIGVATVMLLAVVLFQSLFLREKVNKEIEPAKPTYAFRMWIGISLILLIQRAFFVILDETDIIMVGSFLGPAAAGLYNAAAKTALWVSFVLEIVIMVAAPAFATLYAQGDMQSLQKLVSRVTIWIFWPSIFIGIGLLSFTEPVLSLFGKDFIAASLSLKVLVLGRLADALCGTVACLMVMTGHQNKSLPVFGCSALINLVLNAIAIPRFGIVGAAMTTTFTLFVWNIWLSILVVKHLGVRPSIFYSLFARENQ